MGPWLNRIREFRERAGITQEELAEIVGVSTQAISRYELGDRVPRLRFLRQIAVALDCHLPELFTEYFDMLEGGELVREPDELALLRRFRNTDAADRRAIARLVGLPSLDKTG